MNLAIHQEIEIGVPVERVFAAWTKAEHLTKWWGDDERYRVTGWECDLRAGGKWISRGKSKDGTSFSVSGEYTRVEPPHRLTFTWSHDWGDDPEISLVDLEFISIKTGTLLKLTHTEFKSEKSRADHEQGWKSVCNWMRTYVEAQS